MRYLGIDYGAKRIGLANADDLGLATPLPALIEAAGEKRWAKLGEVIKARRITALVVGYPYNMDGTAGFKAKEVDAFVAELKARFGLPVHLVDETLTSYAAESSIKKKDLRDVRDTGLIDSRAATIILQDFLDQRNPPLMPTE
jgi:putative holliday junction resolvase